MGREHILKSISFIALLCATTGAGAQDNDGGHSKRGVRASGEAASAISHSEHGAMSQPAATKLLPNYGNGGFPIATNVPAAQAFFANGIELAFAFAHHEAIDAMAESVRLDPDCAMCLAGHAYALGPTLNYGKEMEERAAPFGSGKAGPCFGKIGRIFIGNRLCCRVS